MKLQLGELVGDGAFAGVYEAVDDLGRRVAVKIIRASGAAVSTALDHARALARAQHPNVVTVFALDRVTDPETGLEADCVVMELLQGETLRARLRRSRLTLDDARAIGECIISGLRHIHAQGMAHGDLHEDNVMAVGTAAKLIDLLYLDSLALLSTAPRDARLRRDVLSLRVLLYEVLFHSDLDPGDAVEFNTGLGSNASLEDIAAAFQASVDPARRLNLSTLVDHAAARVRDEGFVEGDQYAKAMGDETPTEITEPLLLRLIADATVVFRHRPYLRLLWERLSADQRQRVAAALASALDREVPRGRWSPHLNMLAAFGKSGWESLPATTRLRLESLIVNDILAGHHDIYGPTVGNPGTLGTFAKSLWPYFANRDALVDNLAAKLNQGWYGQNYVGKQFMKSLPLIADTDSRRKLIIDGLAEAVRNDAKVVIRELTALPDDWQREIAHLSNDSRSGGSAVGPSNP